MKLTDDFKKAWVEYLQKTGLTANHVGITAGMSGNGLYNMDYKTMIYQSTALKLLKYFKKQGSSGKKLVELLSQGTLQQQNNSKQGLSLSGALNAFNKGRHLYSPSQGCIYRMPDVLTVEFLNELDALNDLEIYEEKLEYPDLEHITRLENFKNLIIKLPSGKTREYSGCPWEIFHYSSLKTALELGFNVEFS